MLRKKIFLSQSLYPIGKFNQIYLKEVVRSAIKPQVILFGFIVIQRTFLSLLDLKVLIGHPLSILG